MAIDRRRCGTRGRSGRPAATAARRADEQHAPAPALPTRRRAWWRAAARSAHAGAVIANARDQRGEREDHGQRRQVRPSRQRADARPAARSEQLGARARASPARCCRADTRARSRGTACNRGCRPWPAGTAPARSRAARIDRRVGGVAAALDAVGGPAACGRCRVAHLQLGRRHRRRDEVELADRAEVLAERRAGERQVDRPAPRRSSRARATPSARGSSHRSKSS